MHSLLIAGLAQMDSIADPIAAALVTIPGLDIIGRLNGLSIGGKFLFGGQPHPLHHLFFILTCDLTTIMALPHTAHRLHIREVSKCVRCVWRVEPGEEALSIFADCLPLPLPFAFTTRAAIFNSSPIPLIPTLGNPTFEPLRRNRRDSVEGPAERFCHQL
jgi:hypothetical protein